MSDVVAPKSSDVMPDAIALSIERQIDKSIGEMIDRVVSERLEKSLKTKVDEAVEQKVDAAIERYGKQRRSNWENKYEKVFEDRIVFGSRWLLAPAYVLLIVALIVLLYQSVVETVQLVVVLKTSGFNEVPILIQALTIIDVILVMNLLLMVMLVGYTNFVSKIHPSRSDDWPNWTRELDYSGLKLQVLGSIIAISAIGLLREFFTASESASSITPWQVQATVGLHLTFVLSAIVIAFVNRLHVKRGKEDGAAVIDS